MSQSYFRDDRHLSLLEFSQGDNLFWLEAMIHSIITINAACFILEYKRAMKKMWLESRKKHRHAQKEGYCRGALHLKVFKQELSKRHHQYYGSEQHDAQELLSFLISSLHEELKAAPRKVENLCGFLGIRYSLLSYHTFYVMLTRTVLSYLLIFSLSLSQ